MTLDEAICWPNRIGGKVEILRDPATAESVMGPHVTQIVVLAPAVNPEFRLDRMIDLNHDLNPKHSGAGSVVERELCDMIVQFKRRLESGT